jgi:formate dehydrogenase gamma subunit
MTKKAGYLLKHETATRVFHWINLVVFLLLLFSGLAIYNKNLQFFAVIFGGMRNTALMHQYLGFVYIIVPMLYVGFYFKLFKKFISVISDNNEDDKKWLKVQGGYAAPLITGEIPPQSKYNAGQKTLGWVVMLLSCILAVTGLIMIYYTYFPPVIVRMSYLVHAFAAIFLSCGVIVHFYLASLHPKSSKEFKTMMGNGYIEEDFAKHHNYKWWKEMTNKSEE